MMIDIRSLSSGNAKLNVDKAGKPKGKSTKNSSASSGDGDSDSIEITSQASQISRLVQQMKSAPVLDPDRVSPIQEKLGKGEYHINHQQVANKMLDFESAYEGSW
jgi:flagellar biosynthesis anti-sigma factor FlgM